MKRREPIGQTIKRRQAAAAGIRPDPRVILQMSHIPMRAQIQAEFDRWASVKWADPADPGP